MRGDRSRGGRWVEQASERRLLARIASGDERAFAALHHRYAPALYRTCLATTADPHDAHDALQATLLAAYTALRDAPPPDAPAAWLHTIARHRSLDLVRRRRPTTSLNEEHATPFGVDETVMAKEAARRVLEDLAQLTEQQRTALVLHELNGLDYDGVAAALDTSYATAKQLVYKARTALVDTAAGRDMRCESVRSTLADGDRRTARGRRLRAHLRDCADCRAFVDGLERKRRALGAYFPALPALAVLAPPGGRGPSAKLTAAAAVAVAAVIAAVMALTGAPPDTEPVAVAASAPPSTAGEAREPSVASTPVARRAARDRRPSAGPAAHRAMPPAPAPRTGRQPAAERRRSAPSEPPARTPAPPVEETPAPAPPSAPVPAATPVPGPPSCEETAKSPIAARDPEHPLNVLQDQAICAVDGLLGEHVSVAPHVPTLVELP